MCTLITQLHMLVRPTPVCWLKGAILGKAYGIVTLLRALPFTASQRQTYLPLSLLNKVRPNAYFGTHSAAFCGYGRCISRKELEGASGSSMGACKQCIGSHRARAGAPNDGPSCASVFFFFRAAVLTRPGCTICAAACCGCVFMVGSVTAKRLQYATSLSFACFLLTVLDAFDPALHAPDPWLFARLYWAHIRGMY